MPLIPKRYQNQPWAQSAQNAVTRARKSAAATRKEASSPTGALMEAVPGSLTVLVTGLADEKYGNIIPIGDSGLSTTEVAAIALPVAAFATGSRRMAQAAAGPLHVAAYMLGRKAAQKMNG